MKNSTLYLILCNLWLAALGSQWLDPYTIAMGFGALAIYYRVSE